MKEARRRFRAGALKDTVIKGLPRDTDGNYAVSREIRQVSMLFIELQEKRHLADYDLSERLEKSEVLTLIDEARARAEVFREISPTSNDRKFFLACLWAWKDLANR